MMYEEFIKLSGASRDEVPFEKYNEIEHCYLALPYDKRKFCHLFKTSKSFRQNCVWFGEYLHRKETVLMGTITRANALEAKVESLKIENQKLKDENKKIKSHIMDLYVQFL